MNWLHQSLNKLRIALGLAIMPKRLFIVAPASPGSKGDEGIIRGVLRLTTNIKTFVLNPDPSPLWKEIVEYNNYTNRSIIEFAGPFDASQHNFTNTDALLFLGADVIDGSCGVEPSLSRIELAKAASTRGAFIAVFCSFRSTVNPIILQAIKETPRIKFFLRDSLSLTNFYRQTGIHADYFPDFFNFCKEIRTPRVSNHIEILNHKRKSHAPIVGVNFSEQSFRSFYDIHTTQNRESFVSSIFKQISVSAPNAFFVLISNDSRSWENHPSDEFYQELSNIWLCNNGYNNRFLVLNGNTTYPEILSIIPSIDIVVTGRMHLTLASFRGQTIPIIIMGTQKDYTNIDKMRGMFLDYLDNDLFVVSDIDTLADIIANSIENRKHFQQILQLKTKSSTKSIYHWRKLLRHYLSQTYTHQQLLHD